MKKAQITLFIIIGIILIAIVGITVFIFNYVQEQKLEQKRDDIISGRTQPAASTNEKSVQGTTQPLGTIETNDDATTQTTQTDTTNSPPSQPVAQKETCTDNIKNNGESGIDCGGPCRACTCSDGTPKSTCSTGRPNYCSSELKLNPSCTQCGCPQGLACAADGTCTTSKYNLIYVPIGEWPSDDNFNAAVKPRANFFKEISPLQSKAVANLEIPLDFASKRCRVDFTDLQDKDNHRKAKFCADTYADSLGISYERAIGLSNTYAGGYTFMGNKVALTTLGHGGQERPGIIPHELGHTYFLCDEYNYEYYTLQGANKCPNKWPTNCKTELAKCLGNTPVFRLFGDNILGACGGKTSYSVMGWSLGAECGYDKTGGYEKLARELN